MRGISKTTTQSQSLMSRPSSTTAVATRTLQRPELKSSMVSRWPPSPSQLMAFTPDWPTTALGDSSGWVSRRCFAKNLADFLASTKTRVREFESAKVCRRSSSRREEPFDAERRDSEREQDVSYYLKRVGYEGRHSRFWTKLPGI